MFPGMNKKMIEQAMKKLNMKQETIDAYEVIIKGSKNYIIKDPEVIKVDMMGQEVLQVTGKIEEMLNEEDIKTVMEQAKCSRQDAIKSLNKYNGDLAEAILSLK